MTDWNVVRGICRDYAIALRACIDEGQPEWEKDCDLFWANARSLAAELGEALGDVEVRFLAFDDNFEVTRFHTPSGWVTPMGDPSSGLSGLPGAFPNDPPFP